MTNRITKQIGAILPERLEVSRTQMTTFVLFGVLSLIGSGYQAFAPHDAQWKARVESKLDLLLQEQSKERQDLAVAEQRIVQLEKQVERLSGN
jgi:hypothetical protein